MRVAVAALCVFLLLGCVTAVAQQGCALPSPIAPSPGNIFSPAQEVSLGEVMAEHMERNFRLVHDDKLNAYLQKIADRLQKQLPADIPIRVRLVDIPEINAYAAAGGRVYVTRKLVAFARSEDELAGVIGHEIGHALSRDAAASMSRLFRAVLGVASVGDNQDIREKYNSMLDNVARRKVKIKVRGEDDEQLSADRVAIFALARAGYDPNAYVEVWDRMAETRGSTGNWLSDLFGATRPESKRLRELLNATGQIPPECIAQYVKNAGEFEQWRAAVIETVSTDQDEILPGLLAHKQLTPPLRADITHLRFSSDGKYVLAQDESTIFVLTRQPFAFKFRIEAEDAYPAEFTPDSNGIVFRTHNLHVELWSIESEKRTEAHEVAIRGACLQSALSPDGRYLGCLGTQFDLKLVDVTTGEIAFEKKAFYQLTLFDSLLFFSPISNGTELSFMNMAFSPDARYFAAGRRENTIAIDLSTLKPMNMSGKVRELIGRRFTFMTPDTIVGIAGDRGEKSAVLRFPSGEVVRKDLLLGGGLSPVAKGDYLLLRPVQDYPLGLFDIKQNKITLGNKTGALDVYGDTFISERKNGEIGLYNLGAKEPEATLTLPESWLGRLQAVDITDDLRLLALSQRSRGGVWDLDKGKRLAYTRGFRGAMIASDQHAFADFPQYEKLPRSMSDFNLVTGKPGNAYVIAELESDVTGASEKKKESSSALKPLIWQRGRYLLRLKPLKKDWQSNCDFEVADARSRASLWHRRFDNEVPKIDVTTGSGDMLLRWDADTEIAKEVIKNSRVLKSRYEALHDKRGAQLIVAVDARSGAELATVIVETGTEASATLRSLGGSVIIKAGNAAFDDADAQVAGPWIMLKDAKGRFLLYSRADGERRGVFFGNNAELSPNGDLLVVENEAGHMASYSPASGQKITDYRFDSAIAFMHFSYDSRRLFVLTRAQHVYWLQVPAPGQ